MLIHINEAYLESNTDLRLDKFLYQYFQAEATKLSRTYLQELISSGAVLVNGRTVKASYRLELGDQIELAIPEPRSLDLMPEEIALDIVYEDEDLIVINKPINMLTHPAPGLNSGTLVNALLHHIDFGELREGINGHLRPGIVHRLDKDTSGLIVVAKTSLAHQSLSEQIHSRNLERRYLALVEANVKNKTSVQSGLPKGFDASINLPIGRHPVHRHKMSVILDSHHKARRALTYYKIRERYKFKNIFFTLLECKLDTGRTHQIRVHLSHLKHPIVGDSTYGASDKILKAPRPMLHAYSLSFDHPRTASRLSFKAEIPADMQRLLDLLSAHII